MNSNQKLLDDAAQVMGRIRALRDQGSEEQTDAQIDELAKAITQIALYLAARDQVPLTQP